MQTRATTQPMAIKLAAGLLVLEGPTRGVRHVFEHTVTLGRDDECAIQFFDDAVAGQQCRIARDTVNGGYTVEDLAGGTTLNGEACDGAQRLFHRDLIAFGGVELRFDCMALARSDETRVALASDATAVSQVSETVQIDAPPTDSTGRLLALLELTRALANERTVDDLLRRLDRRIDRVVATRRLVLFRCDGDVETLRPARMRKASDDPTGYRIRIHRELVEGCVEQAIALTVESEQHARVAAPLLGRDGQVHGVLYVELANPAGMEAARDLLAIAAVEAGRAIERCELESQIGYQNLKLTELTRKLSESEQRHRRFVEHSLLGVFYSTVEGGVESANPALLRMLGDASIEELRARALELYVPGEYDRAQFVAAMERDGHVAGLETRWRRADGTLAYFRENAVAVRDGDGTIVGYEGTIEEIASERVAQTKLSAVIEQMPVALVALGQDGSVTLCNAAAAERLGRSRDEVLGQPLGPDEVGPDAWETEIDGVRFVVLR